MKADPKPKKDADGRSDGADDTTEDDNQPGGDDDPGEDLPPIDEGDPELTPEQLLADCGGTSLSGAAPDAVVYEKTLASLPTVKSVLIIQITLDTTLRIKVTGAATEQESTTKVSKVVGPLLAEFARTEAEKKAAEASGKVTFTNVPFSGYAELSGKYQAWDGVLCTFVPSTRVENNRGGRRTVSTFAQPLPASISPRAVAGRYAREIGDKRVFSGLKAKIESTDHPDLAGKSELEGSVTVEKTASKVTVDDGNGGKREIAGDLAYKVTTDFGGPQATFALGLAPVVTYFISHTKRDLTANIADTTGAGGAVVVFPHQ